MGLNDAFMPRTKASEIDLEEERRVFYVGITRAKNVLHMVFTDSPTYKHITRFLHNLPPTLCELRPASLQWAEITSGESKKSVTSAEHASVTHLIQSMSGMTWHRLRQQHVLGRLKFSKS